MYQRHQGSPGYTSPPGYPGSPSYSNTGSFSQFGNYNGAPYMTPGPAPGDQIREVRRRSYCERVSGSFVGAGIGVLLVLAALGGLFWNEGRAVQTSMSLDEGERLCMAVHDTGKISNKLNGRLVHMSSSLTIDEQLTDRQFGVTYRAAKLERTVEMLQWVEKKTTRKIKDREETIFTYDVAWKPHLVQSSSFRDPSHSNPPRMPLSSLRLAAKQVHVGVYQLSPTLIEQINDWKTLMPSPVPAALEQQGYRPSGSHFFSGDPLKPKVGDLRISFRYAGRTGMPVSVVARQMHGALQAFPTRAGDMLEMLTPGVVSKEQMFASAKAVNTATTWAVRVGGWLGMWLGFALIANIISTLVSWIPIVNRLVNMATCLFTFTLATTLSLVTIALGWISYRPIIGICVLAAAAIPFVLGIRRGGSIGSSKRD